MRVFITVLSLFFIANQCFADDGLMNPVKAASISAPDQSTGELKNLLESHPELCCLLPADPAQQVADNSPMGRLIALLLWPKLRIVCPEIRRTAYC